MRNVWKNIAGLRVGRLVAIEDTGRIRECDHQHYWKCKCDCGNLCEVEKRALTDSRTLSCGCLQRERTAEASLVHGYGRRYGLKKDGISYDQFKRRTDPKHKVKKNFSCRVRHVLKGIHSGKNLEKILGFSMAQLKSHIESQFEPWMTWENYGQWHLEHIKPHADFNYTSVHDPEFKRCWALSNLRPLSAMDNSMKGAKSEEEFIKYKNDHTNS